MGFCCQYTPLKYAGNALMVCLFALILINCAVTFLLTEQKLFNVYLSKWGTSEISVYTDCTVRNLT